MLCIQDRYRGGSRYSGLQHACCASKIATAVEAGILGYNMHVRNQNFQPDDGLVGETPEETIANIGRLGKQGMKHTNEEIIKIMVGE